MNRPPPELEYRLLRVFDFDVKPTHVYRYRVKVSLRNPNFGVPAKYLKDPAAKPTETLETAWSDPSPTAAVPNGYGVLAGGPGEHWKSYEPSASLMVTSLEVEEGLEAATQFQVWRGSVANSAAATSFAIDPRDNAISELVNRNFKSDSVVVDINGGRPLSNKPKSTLASPIEVLVLDSEGNLQVRRELADHSQVDARTPHIEEAESKKDEKDKKDKRQEGRPGSQSRCR